MMSTLSTKANASKSLSRKRLRDEDGYPLDFLGRMLSVGDVVAVPDILDYMLICYVEKIYKSSVHVRDPKRNQTYKIYKPYHELIKIDPDDVPPWYENVKFEAAQKRTYA